MSRFLLFLVLYLEISFRWVYLPQRLSGHCLLIILCAMTERSKWMIWSTFSPLLQKFSCLKFSFRTASGYGKIWNSMKVHRGEAGPRWLVMLHFEGHGGSSLHLRRIETGGPGAESPEKIFFDHTLFPPGNAHFSKKGAMSILMGKICTWNRLTTLVLRF